MTQITDTSRFSLLPHEAGFDPIEERLRMNVRATIEAVFEEELASFLGRLRYDRGDGAAKGYRHGHRERQLTGTFGTETVRVPRARIEDETGKVTEWRSNALPRYQRLTKKAETLIAAVYLAGTNTRRVKRALFGLFEGAVSKAVVSRARAARSRSTGTPGVRAASPMRISSRSPLSSDQWRTMAHSSTAR
jgi:putative transposase